MQPSADAQRPLAWSNVPITFDAADHPDRTSGVGVLPLVLSPVIHNVTVTKMLVDGGAGLNLISAKLLGKLQVPRGSLVPSDPFHGVNPGATQPLGKVVLPVTFGTRENYRTENVVFNVSDMPLPYNGILGRPALAKFMAVAHYAYNTLKMPAEWGVLAIKADIKDAIFCIEQIYKAAAVSEPAAEPTGSQEDEPGSSTPEGCYHYACLPSGPKNAAATTLRAAQGVKRPREAPGEAPGTTPEGSPREATSVGPAPRQPKIKGEPQLTKKVPLHGDTTRCVVIGATLSSK